MELKKGANAPFFNNDKDKTHLLSLLYNLLSILYTLLSLLHLQLLKINSLRPRIKPPRQQSRRTN
jgi:hypothetical protein